MKIIYKRGYAVNKRVDTVVNSANGFLLLGTTGAGEIRKKSQRLTPKEKKEYNTLLNRLPKRIRNDYIRVYKEQRWTPTYAQLDCLKLLVKKNKHEFMRGDAVLQENWSKKDSRPIIHAVSMSYRLRIHDASRLPATTATIRRAMAKAFKIADSIGSKSVALPVCCARKSYGMTPEKSFKLILSVLKSLKPRSIKKVIICFDNKVTSAYLRSITH